VTPGELAVMFQNFLTCVEMFIASVLLVYGFGYKEYEITDEMGKNIVMRDQVTRNFKKVRRVLCWGVDFWFNFLAFKDAEPERHDPRYDPQFFVAVRQLRDARRRPRPRRRHTRERRRCPSKPRRRRSHVRFWGFSFLLFLCIFGLLLGGRTY
jgi:hypothetical protein